jgi:hypothetical protein
MFGLLAVLHPEEVDPVDHGLLAGRGDADKLALVGAGVGHPAGHQLALGDHVVDLDPHIREGLLNRAEELLGLLGVLAAEGVVDPIGGQQRINGVQVAAVDDVLVEPPHRLLVVLCWHGPLRVQLPELPDGDWADHSRDDLRGLPPLPGGGLASVQADLEQVGGRWDLLVRPPLGVPTSGRQARDIHASSGHPGRH